MRINKNSVFEAILILGISIFWCEFGYYYFVFYFNCSTWPGIEGNKNDQNLTKFLVIADTHIMGPIKSVWVDKLRREWQMKQAFKISRSLFKPDVVVFMGDLLDEGSMSQDQYFGQACDDFDRIFPYDSEQEDRIIIAGNHDVGFHNQMRNFPFLVRRFQERYTSTSSIELVQTPKTKNLNIIASNSMSFYNDTCPFCSHSMKALNELETHLDQKRRQNPHDYSLPILLGHIPLYRKNDLNCTYPTSLVQKVAKNNIEGEEVLHLQSSRAIVTKLEPRLAISGHTHMLCITEHPISQDSQDIFEEITISSYNHKYAELRPGFLLLTINSSHVYKKHCSLIEEWVVISIYIATLFTIIYRMVVAHVSQSDDELILTDQLENNSSNEQYNGRQI